VTALALHLDDAASPTGSLLPMAQGSEAGYVEFVGAQFHGTSRFDGSRFDRTSFTLDGPSGRATFHGDVVFAANPSANVVVHGAIR
jgi:hypothetical protein